MRRLCRRNSITPITPRIMPPTIVAMPIFSIEVLSFDNCISAKPRISAANVVRIYDRRVLSLDMKVLSSSNFIILVFFMDLIVEYCY